MKKSKEDLAQEAMDSKLWLKLDRVMNSVDEQIKELSFDEHQRFFELLGYSVESRMQCLQRRQKQMELAVVNARVESALKND